MLIHFQCLSVDQWMSELRMHMSEHHANREFQQAVHQGSWWDGIILSDGRKCFAEKTFLPFSGSDGVPSVWLSGTPTVARVTEMYGTRFAEMYARNFVTAREMYARNWVASEWAGGTCSFTTAMNSRVVFDTVFRVCALKVIFRDTAT
jgi:hypothetical protein